MDTGLRAVLLAAIAAAARDADVIFLNKADELELPPSAAVALRELVADEFRRLADAVATLTASDEGRSGPVTH